MATTLTLNGQPTTLDVDPEMPLLWALRETPPSGRGGLGGELAGLTGAKFGCGLGLCGACTVHLDGVAVRACTVPVADVAGKSVTTIEGVAGPVGDAVLAAWERGNVVQCGYCQPGQIMAAVALLTQTADPSDEEIDAAMTGNLCRCGTYVRIRAAIQEAAHSLEV